jgi:hypothetical protein
MQPRVRSGRSVFASDRTSMEALPDPVPRPPGRAPGEPIIIRRPPGPAEVPEIDETPGDEDEDDPEIERPPDIVPEKRPPPAPWERADRPSATPRRAGRP